ncbi:MAG: tetratricopeptide repeat protein [Abditibacteriaceae bacterium]
MSFNYLSKLPVWVRPLPPGILLCAFAALGYSLQQQSPATPVSDTVATQQQDPATSAPLPPSHGTNPLFTVPGTSPTTPTAPATPGASPGLDLNNNSITTLNKTLTLSKNGAAGVALEKFRNSPLAKSFGKAMEDQKQGRTAAAIAGYRDVLHQMPDALPAHLNLAIAYLQAGQPAQAVPHLQVVAKADPKNVNVQFELAKVLLDLKRLDDAQIPLQRVVKLMPQNPQPHVLLAQLYFTQKNYAGAFDQWTALDKIDAGKGQPAFAAGSIAVQNLKDPKKALPWLRKAHRLAPTNDQATLLLGQSLAATGNTKEAAPLIAQIATKNPQDAGIVRMLAQMQWQSGDHDAAISSLQKVISLDPNNKEARSALAQALSARADSQAKAGKFTDASNTWQQVQQLYPDNQLPRVRRAELLRKMGRDDDAKQLYQQVLQNTPKDPNALLGVAGIAMKNKNYNTAYDNFWRAIQEEPQFQPAYEAFVVAATKTHQEKDAYLLLQNWVKKHPNLDPAQKALQALTPAANKLPELTPLNSNNAAPNIKTDRPPTLTTPPKATPPKPKATPATKTSAPTNKPQMTPAGHYAAKSRISPLKPITPQTTAPKVSPEPSAPEN